MTNDFRIRLNSSNKWTWIKSPWDDGHSPLFDLSKPLSDQEIKN